MNLPTIWVWAARDVMRRPGEAALAGVAMASFVAIFAAALLLAQGLADTADVVLEEAPSLVLRRVGPGGWAPVPDGAAERLGGVRGVVRAHARVWGVARWEEAAVTVVGLGADRAREGVTPPARGLAVVGPGVGVEPGSSLRLSGAAQVEVRVAERLPGAMGIAAHDLVFVHPDDARAVLGLAQGSASDLAVWVRHDSEVDAIRGDLEAALPFPVSTRSARERRGAARMAASGWAGLRAMLLVPALLALILMSAVAARIQLGGRRDVGLLKALGWTTGDIVLLHGARALVVGLPSVAVGWGVAYGLVFWSGLGWLGSWLLGWAGEPPWLVLSSTGAWLTLLEVGALVLAPWLAATLLPVLIGAATDPEEWLRGEEG